MPKRSVRTRRRNKGCLSRMIVFLSVVALLLVAAIVINNRLAARERDTAQVTGSGNYVDVNDLPVDENQLVLNADSFVKRTGAPDIAPITATPEPTPAPTPTPEPTYNPDEPYALVRPQPTEPGYLPIFKKANTDERRIAVTVDECSGVKITTSFAKAAAEKNAKLTLFPTGDNIMKDTEGMGKLFQHCVFNLGFEIENRCYSSSGRLYRSNDQMMATEIWKQTIAVSYVLGVKYEPHFLRLYGGDGENDLRTHTYLIQENYIGIADWSVNGSKVSSDRIADTLAPGNIYYFKSNQSDLTKMTFLLEEAQRQGYEVVTLNELFGYDANHWEEPEGSLLSETLPELKNRNIPYYFMTVGDCTWAVSRVQRRLTELGYLPAGNTDGIFGQTTASALSAFQARCGIAATGAADVETQEYLFADDAPRAVAEKPKKETDGESAQPNLLPDG